jgi:MoaA/NifB/PqqE/SkfB family radical SAM enzyme
VRLYYLNRSGKAWYLLFRHFLIKTLKKDIPNVITIGLTYRCQCHCVHCSSNVPNRKQAAELKTWQVKSIIDQAKKLGVVRITFFGGEPLLRNDIVELTQYAHKVGMITRINTNGWLLNRELISKLKDAGLNLCDVSIDDPDPQTHNRLRGLPGIYKKAVEGIKILKEFNILCQIVTYAARKNVTTGLEEIINLGRRLGVFAVSIIFPITTGCWLNRTEVLLTEEEKERVRQLGDSDFVHIELPTSASLCNVCKKASIYVAPEGNVTPCPFIPYAIGNIKQEPLHDIWRRLSSRCNLKMVGNCPMNDAQCRETLKNLAIA